MNLFKPLMTAVLILLSLQTIAQEKSKRLYVGDKVPEIEFKGMYNYPTKTSKLSDFKGKAVILDFWNKDCGSCIASFPKLQNIQNEFRDELVILLINDQPDQTKEALETLFKNSSILKATTLPMVLGDSTFSNTSELFPHWGVGHHVWINKRGIIEATTMGYEATRENIQKLIKGDKLDVIRRVDIQKKRDSKTSRLAYEDGLLINNMVYYNSENFKYKNCGESIDLSSFKQLRLGEQSHSMFMKGFFEGNLAGGMFGGLYDNGNVVGSYVRGNIVGQYQYAYETFGKGIYQVVFDDSVPNLEERYIYEYACPTFKDSLFKITYINDLEDYFGYKANEDRRWLESYVIYRTEKALKVPISRGGIEIYENTQSNRGFVIQNMTIRELFNLLSGSKKDIFGNDALVFDETGIDQEMKIDMVVHGSLGNLQEMNNSLLKYGLGIKKVKRYLPVLVLRNLKEKLNNQL